MKMFKKEMVHWVYNKSTKLIQIKNSSYIGWLTLKINIILIKIYQITIYTNYNY